MPTLVRGLEEAFAYFGGVPRACLFDQMKAVITRDERMSGGPLVRSAEFIRFATHWGFVARACRPYRAQTKGKVERPIRYVRKSFLYGREFIGDDDLDERRGRWLESTANAHVHGTTHEVPRERFTRDEAHVLLLPLAARPYHSLTLVARAERAEKTERHHVASSTGEPRTGEPRTGLSLPSSSGAVSRPRWGRPSRDRPSRDRPSRDRPSRGRLSRSSSAHSEHTSSSSTSHPSLLPAVLDEHGG